MRRSFQVAVVTTAALLGLLGSPAAAASAGGGSPAAAASAGGGSPAAAGVSGGGSPAAAGVSGGGSPAAAGDLLPPAYGIPAAIDHYVGLRLEREGIAPAPPADWQTLLRRTALDLAGRIPTAAEYRWIATVPEPQRRLAMVDHFASLSDFAFHLRNSLDELLLPNEPHNGEFRDYLLWAVQTRRPWDQLFRDLLLARTADGPEKGAIHFVRSRARDLDELTNETSSLLFGVNVSCAKCHDHPLVDQWRQEHFYGMKAFFSRTFVTRRQVVTERPFGQVSFKTTGGEDKTAAFTFLNGAEVADASPTLSDEERKQLDEQLRRMEQNDQAGYVLFPDFSPRRALVEVALADDGPRFLARNIVNRTWQRLLGVGLVDPPDQLHEANPPSHPELMDWLVRDLVAHRYDLRRLIRGIVLSETYARSSRWVSTGEPPAPASFALAATRPLTPRQFATSLLVAARCPDQEVATAAVFAGGGAPAAAVLAGGGAPAAAVLAGGGAPAAADDDDAWAGRRQDLENQANGWVREFEVPGEGFQVAVDEALFFTNNERVQGDLLRDSADALVGRLRAIESDEDLVRELWHRVLTRDPGAEEMAASIAWLGRPGERTATIRGLAWSVLAGAEARFNH